MAQLGLKRREVNNRILSCVIYSENWIWVGYDMGGRLVFKRCWRPVPAAGGNTLCALLLRVMLGECYYFSLLYEKCDFFLNEQCCGTMRC